MNADNDKYWMERWKGIALCEKADNDRLRRSLKAIRECCREALYPLSAPPSSSSREGKANKETAE